MESSGGSEETTPMEGLPAAPKKRPWGIIAAIIVVAIVVIAAVAYFVRPQNAPPVVNQVTVSSEFADVGTQLTFTAQATDPDNDPLTYSWNFGDGTTGTGASPTHAYSVPGRYVALVTVDDAKGGTATNDGKLVFPEAKVKPADVVSPDPCPAGASKNNTFSAGGTAWTFAHWVDATNVASGGWRSTGGNPGAFVNITTGPAPTLTVSGYWYQSFTVTGSAPFVARASLNWNLSTFGAGAGGDVTVYAFVDTTSGLPTIGQEVWASTPQTATTTWAKVSADASSKISASGTYYLKIAARTRNGAVSTNSVVGFDNAKVTWSQATCPSGSVYAILSADQTTTQTGTQVTFNANASWAFWFTWNDWTDRSLGGTYSVTAAGAESSLFSQLRFTWGDGTANTTGTSKTVGQTKHTFAAVGNYFVKLTVTYTNTSSTLTPSTRTASAGYSVRVLAAAPPTQVKYKDIFTTVTIGEPDFLDPATDYETAGGEVLQNVYETLIWYQQGTESIVTLVPRLATAVPTVGSGISADGKNYTFDLRAGVKFHSGTTMSADDVVYSIQRVLAIHDPDGPSWILEQVLSNFVGNYAGASSCGATKKKVCTIGDWVNDSFAGRTPAIIPPSMLAVLPAPATWDTTPLTVAQASAVGDSSIAKTGPLQVVIHLTRPYPAFLQAMAFTVGSVLEKACVQANGGVVWATHNDWLDRSGDCGTGPFYFSLWVPNQVLVMKRFDSYWRTPASLKEIHIAKANDISTRELMLLAGDADVAAIGRDHQFDVMNQDGTPKYSTLRIVKDKATITVDFVGYNQNIRGTPPDPLLVPRTFFADVHVRKAFSYVFNYQNYIHNVLHDGGAQLRGPIPQPMLGFNSSIPLFTYDLAKAKQELSLTPYCNAGFSLTLYYNAGNTARETGSILLKQGIDALFAAGAGLCTGTVSIGTRALDWPVYLATLRAYALPIFFLGWAPDYADPDDYVVPFLHSGGTFPNRIAYSNATLDARIDAAAALLDNVKRDKAYQDLSARAVLDDVPYLWLDQRTSFHVERTWVGGYYFNAMLSGLDYYPCTKS
jgi:peptide/nickel transport system substrate-binding protein